MTELEDLRQDGGTDRLIQVACRVVKHDCGRRQATSGFDAG
jgi:hypothetical protein